MQIRFIKNFKRYRKGQVVNVKNDLALMFINQGIAIKDKMMDTGVRYG